MFYLTPFILTFLSNASFSFIIAAYGFIHADLTHTFNMNKIQFGVVYGIASVGTVIGTLLFFVLSSKIKQKIVTFYTWGCSFISLFYLLIVLSSIVFENPHKSILMIIMFFVGVIRSIYFPCIVLITKIHEDIAQNKIDQSYDKLVKSIWSITFDFGMITGFFTCNWLYYTCGWTWESLLILGVTLHLIMNAITYIILMPYIQQFHNQGSIISDNQNKSKAKKINVKISQLFDLLSKHTSSQLFLVNNAILQALHLNICFVLPPYFYYIGDKGHEGYLIAIYSIFITIGSTFLGLIDFVVEKIYHCIQKRKTQQNKNLADQDNPIIDEKYANQKSSNSTNLLKAGEDRQLFLIISSVFLFIFFIMELVMMFTALRIHVGQHIRLQASQIAGNMIKVCILGFFFGGPIKSYLSYRILVTMRQLNQFNQQTKSQINEQQNSSLVYHKDSQKNQILAFEEKSFWSRVKSHKVELGSAFVALSRVIVYLVSIFFYLISFFLIQKYVTYLFIFLSCMGLLGVIFDIVQDVYFFRRLQSRKKDAQKVKQLK